MFCTKFVDPTSRKNRKRIDLACFTGHPAALAVGAAEQFAAAPGLPPPLAGARSPGTWAPKAIKTAGNTAAADELPADPDYDARLPARWKGIPGLDGEAEWSGVVRPLPPSFRSKPPIKAEPADPDYDARLPARWKGIPGLDGEAEWPVSLPTRHPACE